MIKISVSRRINGVTVDSTTFKRKFLEDAKETLRTVRCPEHLQTPTVKGTANGNRRIGGCCQTLIDLANEKLSK